MKPVEEIMAEVKSGKGMCPDGPYTIKLNDILKELVSIDYKGKLFPLCLLRNFKKNPNLSFYKYSVNASMFFALAVMDRLLDEITIDGKKINLYVEDAQRSQDEQLKKYLDWQARCDKDPSLSRTQVKDPRSAHAAHTVGGAIDAVMITKDGRFLPMPNDLLKDEIHGNWISDMNLQNRLKKELFIRPVYDGQIFPAYPDESEGTIWAKKTDGKLVQCEENENGAIRAQKLSNPGWTEQICANIQQTPHVLLSEKGHMNEMAIYAIANVQILNTIYSACPNLTGINNEYWHAQLIDRAADDPNKGGTGGLPSHSVILERNFREQSAFDIATRSAKILRMADSVKDVAIYNLNHLTPWQRIGIGKDAPYPRYGTKEQVIAQINQVITNRNKDLWKLWYQNKPSGIGLLRIAAKYREIMY